MIYALVYMGKGSDEEANTNRLQLTLQKIGHCADKAARTNIPEVRKLTVAKDKTRNELCDWMKAKIRVGTLEETSVIRVWFTDGTEDEQVIIINAILRVYLKENDAEGQDRRSDIDNRKRFLAGKKGRPTPTPGQLKQFQKDEEEYNCLPRLLEWAAVKGKR
jgi:hypothetical protein